MKKLHMQKESVKIHIVVELTSYYFVNMFAIKKCFGSFSLFSSFTHTHHFQNIHSYHTDIIFNHFKDTDLHSLTIVLQGKQKHNTLYCIMQSKLWIMWMGSFTTMIWSSLKTGYYWRPTAYPLNYKFLWIPVVKAFLKI